MRPRPPRAPNHRGTLCFAQLAQQIATPLVDVIIMTSLIFPPFTTMAFSEKEKQVNKFLRQNKHYGSKRCLKCFLIKAGLVMDWIRLFARLIVYWNFETSSRQ